MTALDAANKLADEWPSKAMNTPETGLPVCIETVRHVVDAFHKAGVRDVRPLPCALHLFNRQATAAILGGGVADPEALKVEISPEANRGDRRRGWHGHLVVDHPEFLLDLVLPGVVAAFAGLGRGFDHVTAFCGEKGNQLVDVDGTWMAMAEDGVCYRYEPRPRMAAWRNSDAWRADVDAEVVEKLAAAIAAEL